MGGNAFDYDWGFASPLSEVRNVVLVGRIGNGKSATGNSIIGKRSFKSISCPTGVTSTCEMQKIVLEDGQILNVIDTPGLFDFSSEPDIIGKEIVKCINMVKDGIHAVLVILSIRSRFTREEEAVIESLREFFGNKITDYMIVVFTGGDELEDNNETLNDYLGRYCPKPLKEILQMCGNRRVLFDNKTKDGLKKSEQLKQLISLVNVVVDKNGGRPYTNELFVELERGAHTLLDQTARHKSSKGYSSHEISKLNDRSNNLYDEQLTRITEMVELKLKETAHRLQKQLADEQASRMNAEVAQLKSNYELLNLRENLERAQRETKSAAEVAQLKSHYEIQNLRESLERAQSETQSVLEASLFNSERTQRETVKLHIQAVCPIL